MFVNDFDIHQSESSNKALCILTYLSFFAFGLAYLILLIIGFGISAFGGGAVSTTTFAVTFLGIISSSESSNKFLIFFYGYC